MPVEVEIKVKIEDPTGLEETLLETGGTLLKSEEHEDLYLDHPQYSFADTDEALRIRKIISEPLPGEDSMKLTPRYELTYKGAKMDSISKTREELSVGIDSGKTMETILEAVGFTKVARVRKERSYFCIDDISLALDCVENLGWFLEAEKVVEDKQRMESSRTALFELLDRLLSGEYESIRESYLELLLNQ
ncbi:MAG: class IV adenylate cyclase [Candidatus Lokiarchaeota archaeon]|nr:class IV adenylate cyclase [Candidatus Lokiarchaeota archaeon]